MRERRNLKTRSLLTSESPPADANLLTRVFFGGWGKRFQPVSELKARIVP